MPLSLHAAFIPSALQMIGTARHLTNKGEAWCDEQGKDHSEVIGARLIEDMLPFTYQVKCVAEHTAGALAAVKKGIYSPDLNPPPASFAELHAKLDTAEASLKALSVDDLEAFIGQDMRFEFKDMKMDFTAENFLLSFAQPNFYFHAATAYDILRMLGVQIGKRDFTGAVRIKMP